MQDLQCLDRRNFLCQLSQGDAGNRKARNRSDGLNHLLGTLLITTFLLLILATTCKADSNLSPHFKASEFTCKCCGALTVYTELIDKLERLRTELCAPIIVTSGYRCPKHNAEVGGVVDSQHIEGAAADIKVKGVSPAEVAEAAKWVGFTFIKVYSTWTHVDVRERK